MAYFVSFVLHRASLLHYDEQLFAPETCFGFEGFTVVLQHVQQQYHAGRNTFSHNSDPNSKEITEQTPLAEICNKTRTVTKSLTISREGIA